MKKRALKAIISLLLCICLVLSSISFPIKKVNAMGGGLTATSTLLELMYDLAIAMGLTAVTSEFGEQSGLFDSIYSTIEDFLTTSDGEEFVANQSLLWNENRLNELVGEFAADSMPGLYINDELVNKTRDIILDSANKINLSKSILDGSTIVKNVNSIVTSLCNTTSLTNYVGSNCSIIDRSASCVPSYYRNIINDYFRQFINDTNSFLKENLLDGYINDFDSYTIIGESFDTSMGHGSFVDSDGNSKESDCTILKYTFLYCDGTSMPFISTIDNTTYLLPYDVSDTCLNSAYNMSLTNNIGSYFWNTTDGKSMDNYKNNFQNQIKNQNSLELSNLSKYFSCVAVTYSCNLYSTGDISDTVTFGNWLFSPEYHPNLKYYLYSDIPLTSLTPYGFVRDAYGCTDYFLFNQVDNRMEYYSSGTLKKTLDIDTGAVSKVVTSQLSTKEKEKTFEKIINDTATKVNEKTNTAKTVVKPETLTNAKTNVISLTDSIATDIPVEGVNVADVPLTLTDTLVDSLVIEDSLVDNPAIADDPSIADDPTIGNDPTKPLVPDVGLDDSDLTKVFPFCIPFDFVDMIQALQAKPQAPSFKFPMYTIDKKYQLKKTGDINVDLSQFDSVASLFRNIMLLVFCIGLMLATKNLVGGGKS